MAFEYEALVGHLYIVNGRAISVAPPGALVEVAPKKAQRGREMDTFFTLVLPSGEVTAPASFYEQMAVLAAERYFSSSGSVTSGVRTLFNALNQNLYEHNLDHQRRYEASLICAVLHGDDLFVARVGAGVALVHIDGDLQPFPAAFENDEVLFGPPLGVQPIPDIKMTRYRVSSGARLTLADANLAEVNMEHMRSALTQPDISQVLTSFKPLIPRQIIMQVIEFVPPEVPVPIAVLEAHSSASLSSASITPTPSPAITEQTEYVVSRGAAARYQAQTGLSRATLRVANGLDGMGKILRRMTAEPEEDQRRWFSGGLTGGLVVLLPVVLVVAVVVMWLGGTGVSEFELCVSEATEATTTARQIASSDRAGTLAAWNGVLVIVERCNEIRAGDEQLASFVREGQTIIDTLNDIRRRDVVTIASFPNAELTRIVQRGEDLYALDDRNDMVYRVTVSSNGLGAVPNSAQQVPRMRRSAAAGQYTVGDILDITWAEDGRGLSQGNVLIALDRNGVVVEYSPTFLSQGAQSLLGTENWNTPVKMTVWQGRLYILDPGANQIWRYEPSGGSYPNAPTEYFTGANRFDISQAVDFGIDDNGRVYVLLDNGVLNVYRSAEPVSFGFANFPNDEPPTAANGMFLNADPVSPGIYMVDRAGRTIYESTLAGTFISSYRTFNEDLYASLADVVADNSKRVIYVVSGNSILAFSK